MKKKHRKNHNRSLELEQRYATQEILKLHLNKIQMLWNPSERFSLTPNELLNLTPDELVKLLINNHLLDNRDSKR